MGAYTTLNIISLICLVIALVMMALISSNVGKKMKNNKILNFVSAALFAVGILLLPVAALASDSEENFRFPHEKEEEEE